MAYALTPAFIAAKQTNEFGKWFYYVSANRFVNLYPWIGRHGWQYSDRMLNNEHVTRIKAAEKEQVIWSFPYKDNAGVGIITSLGAGVYKGGIFTGAIIIDVGVEKIANALPATQDANKGFVLLDQKHNVLAHKTAQASELSVTTSWHELLPEKLIDIFNTELQNTDASRVISDWLIQKQSLSVNGWQLISYQPYSQFKLPTLLQFIVIYLVVIALISAFFAALYLLTLKTFIKPTRAFINHIEHCSHGDPGKVKPTKAWLPWFTIVENIFTQNRSLLQQLKDQNATLDSHVAEKTLALRASIEQQQRDYAQLRSVINAIPDLIFFNDLEGGFIGGNQTFEQFLAQPEKQILGRNVSKYLPENLANALQGITERNQLEQKANNQIIVVNQDKTYEVYSGQFYNDTNLALGFINIIRDVTEQYQNRAELEQAKNVAEHANQAKNQFLANMSHEIRTPINAIQGMMSLLKNTLLNTFQNQYISNAEGAAKSLLYLVDDLLDLAKVETGNMPILKSLCTLDEIIEKALKLNIAQANAKSLNLTIDIQANVPEYIHTDEMRLVQVVNNLLNNAIKFTEKGDITIAVTYESNKTQTCWLKFAVIDTGIGIPKAEQQYLFDVFRQADDSMTRKYGGSGLGLSICQQIVNLLGGEISVQSEPQKGSEFSFTLPFTRTGEFEIKPRPQLQIVAIQVSIPEPFSRLLIGAGVSIISCQSLSDLDTEQLHEVVVLVNESFFQDADQNIGANFIYC